MNLSSKHVILIILAIIIFTFVYNYDVYVVDKSQPICKPIYVTKRILSPDAEIMLEDAGISKVKEGMSLIDDDVLEGFATLMGNTENANLSIPGISLSTFTVSGVTDKKKIKVMDSVIKVLSNIPTNLDANTIKQMIEYFGMIYQTSSSLANFYQNVSSSTKIKDPPYNSKYSQLVLYLIGKFNNDVEDCIEKPKNECGLVINPETETEKSNSKPSSSVSEQETSSSGKPEQQGIVPKYLQCETCNIKPELIKKITSEIVHDVTNEITNEIVHDVTNEIKNIYPKPEIAQEYFNDNNNGDSNSIIDNIIDRILPSKSCPTTSKPICLSCPSHVGPEGEYTPQYRPINPVNQNIPQYIPTSPEGEYTPQYRPTSPEGEYIPQYRPNYPYGESEQTRLYPITKPGYPGIIQKQEKPFNKFPGNFNPPEQRNIQKNKPCYDKCRVNCPVSKPDYLAKSEPFSLVQSYDEGNDYYSLLN